MRQDADDLVDYLTDHDLMLLRRTGLILKSPVLLPLRFSEFRPYDDSGSLKAWTS